MRRPGLYPDSEHFPAIHNDLVVSPASPALGQGGGPSKIPLTQIHVDIQAGTPERCPFEKSDWF